MSRRRRILLPAALAVTLVLAVIVVRWNSSEASLTLVDGSRLTCRAVKVTTRVRTTLQPDTFLARLVQGLPAFLQRITPSAIQHRLSYLPLADGTNLVFWLELDRGDPAGLAFALRDSAGSYIVQLNPMTQRLPDGSTLILLRESVWPRRARELVVEVFNFDFTAVAPPYLAGELRVRNPGRRDYPEWKPDPLPIARQLDETEIKLERMEIRPKPTFQRIAGTNLIERVAFIQFRRTNSTNAGYSSRWALERARMVDATGNQRLLPGNPDLYEETIQIYGVQIPWPGESVYRLETWWRARDAASAGSGSRLLTFTVQPERWERSVPTPPSRSR